MKLKKEMNLDLINDKCRTEEGVPLAESVEFATFAAKLYLLSAFLISDFS